MKNKTAVIVLCIVMALVIATTIIVQYSIISHKDTGNQDVKVFKVSHSFLPSQPTHIVLTEVAENIKKRTNGQIILEIFPNYEIACGPDAIEQVVRDSYFISLFATSGTADWVPDFYVYDTPFACKDCEQYAAMAETDFAKELIEKAEKANIKVLAMDWAYGARCIGTTKKPVTTADDMKGLKIRIPDSPVLKILFNALDSAPIPMSWGDVYTSLETGVIDGMEASLSDYVDNQLWDVIKYITLDNHVIGNEAVLMSAKVFNEELTPEQQKIFTEEFANAGIKYRKLYAEAEQDARATLEKHGVTILEADMESFQNRVIPAMEGSMPGVSDDAYDKMMNALNSINR